jgi:hypothetical protein
MIPATDTQIAGAVIGTHLRAFASPRAPADPSAAKAAKLVVDNRHRQHRLVSVSQPLDSPGLFRAAFSAPLELLSGRSVFALEQDQLDGAAERVAAFGGRVGRVRLRDRRGPRAATGRPRGGRSGATANL